MKSWQARLFVRALLFGAALSLFSIRAHAQAAQAASQGAQAHAPSVPAESWAGQLDALGQWFAQHRETPACTERCYVLESLHMAGSLDGPGLHFELTGEVLTPGPTAVPLFGPPGRVRVKQVVESTGAGAAKPATVGFEGDHYYVWTSSRRFVLRGTFSLLGDLALNIPGPIDTFDADLKGGRVVEGNRLSALSNTTLHFDRAVNEGPATEPTVFQLSRAVRIGREVTFEYRLTMRSGSDLGVARLPLRFGEKVLEVTGSPGWKVEGEELSLPTSGHAAQMVVTGTLPRAGSFAPDARSAYEWWLLESDVEHRVQVDGDARPMDPSESPIPRTQPTARLYLVQKGQHLDVSVQALASAEVLAAVVRSDQRTIVLTKRGDFVADDTFTYENNGIDYLALDPGGRPIFLATDGKPERILHGPTTNETMIPLLTGSHGARVQSLAQTALNPLGGWLTLPMPSSALTTSSVDVTLGLPHRVFPLAVVGGDTPHFFLDSDDAIALAFAFATAWIALRGRRRRLLGAATLAGLWFASAGLFVLLECVLAAGTVIWLARRLTRGRARTFATVGLAVGGGVLVLAFLASVPVLRKEDDVLVAHAVAPQPAAPAPTPVEAPAAAGAGQARAKVGDVSASIENARDSIVERGGAGVLQGVTPVALTLPSYDRAVTLRRELVTSERPFHPVLVYASGWLLIPLGLAWLACAALLARAHRAELRSLRDRLRARMERKGEPAEGPAAPGVAPPTTS